jgi:hypothetical protein
MMTSPWRAHLLAVSLLFALFAFSNAASAQEPTQPEPQQPVTQPAQQAAPQTQQPGQTSPSGSSGGVQPATAQKPGPGQSAQKPAQSGATQSKDRLFFALPNFSTLENAGSVPPLTVGEKFKLITRSSFDPAQFAWYGLISGIGQAEDSEKAYGQGWGAYGKRYATNLADGTVEGYMVSAVFPSVLKQDPRYFIMGKGTVVHRTMYALSRLFITRSDSGHAEFNASEILGSASAAAISTYGYHPGDEKTLSNTGSVWGTQVAYDGIAVVIKEFWPDIRRKLSKKRAADQD